MSNLALMNGSCHSQQLCTLIPTPSTVNSAGDKTQTDPCKTLPLSNQHIDPKYGLNDTNSDIAQSSVENGNEPLVTTSSEEEAPCIDIMINNVVCSFSTKCYLNLKKIATEGIHVEYRRENGMLNMKIRRPNVTATIWSSGNITCTGSTSEDEAKVSARRIARRLQRLGFNARFSNYRVVNVLGTCNVNFGIKLAEFSSLHRMTASYEPELHPGVTYKIKEPKATLKIFSTGSITVTAPCVANVQHAIEHIYPLVVPHKMDAPRLNKKVVKAEKKELKKQGVYIHFSYSDSDEDEDDYEDEEDVEFGELNAVRQYNINDNEVDEDNFSDDFDSDVSHD